MSEQISVGKITHFLYCPFTGLGSYNGFRGNRWLKNRIKIFKQFVVPSLQNQTNKNFVLWCSWRYEEKRNPQVIELKKYLDKTGIKTVFTYSGVCFLDDKYPDEIARMRLIDALHGSMGELINVIGECDEVLMTIQPSDDCYVNEMVEGIQGILAEHKELQAFGFSKGYMMNYLTKEVADYNPETNPPFYTIRFPRDIFTDTLKHIEYTSLKKDVGKYRQGFPLPSHEYVKDCLNYDTLDMRGFLVGCHGVNISTVFNHPYKGRTLNSEEANGVLKKFGLDNVEKFTLPFSVNSLIFHYLPYGVKRKLRYWSEKQWILRPLFAFIYNILRS